MSAALKQNMEQRIMLKLTPQQIQFMKMLQVPSMQMEQRIKEELEINPALEEVNDSDNKEETDFNQEDNHAAEDEPRATDEKEDEFNIDDYVDKDDYDDYDYRLKDNNYRDPEDTYEAPVTFREGFQDYMLKQFSLLFLNEEQLFIGEIIIGNIDDSGYLQRSVAAIVNDLAFTQNIRTTVEEVDFVLKQIQGLEPAGVGARDLRECLMIQIDAKQQDELNTASNNDILQIAYQVLDKYFNFFIGRKYERIMSKLDVSLADFKQAIDVIVGLNPKPGSTFGSTFIGTAQKILPDYYLTNIDGHLELSLNSKNDPSLRVSHTYSSILLDYSNAKGNKKSSSSLQNTQMKETVSFIRQKIDSAKWFIDLIRQRQNTLLNVMQSILDFQYDYFISGDISKLRPMILKDIADITNLDISTISRVTANKYIQTHFGVFLLKNFFSQSLQNEEGVDVSTTRIKDVVLQLIEDEDKKSPLTDEAIVIKLKEKGFIVARRTVAKYRESLNMAVARLRREI